MEEGKKRVYVFADGPNLSYGDFRIDVSLLKDHINGEEGQIGKFIWYDIEPGIEEIDFEREQTPLVNSLIGRTRATGTDLCGLIAGLDNSQKEVALSELAKYFMSIQRTRVAYNNKSAFLHSIGGIVNVCTFPGKSFKNTKKCVECNKDVVFVGKTEGGVTDFNLAIDLLNHARRDDYDIAVLGSGDAHYVRPVSFVRDMGKSVVVYSFNDSINNELRSVADKFVSLDSLYDKIKRERI